MPNNMMPVTGKPIDSFDIPVELAKRLSELLITQSIRVQLLDQNIDNPERYEIMEEKLVPVYSEIEAIKAKITKDYVPDKYKSEKYVWNYDGFEVDKTKVFIYNA